MMDIHKSRFAGFLIPTSRRSGTRCRVSAGGAGTSARPPAFGCIAGCLLTEMPNVYSFRYRGTNQVQMVPGWSRLVPAFHRERETKKPSPRSSERGRLRCERILVVVVILGRCRVVEFARGPNRLFAGIGPTKSSGQVPV